MHDMARSSEAFGRYDGIPCVGSMSISSGEVFDLLDERCLLDYPIQCGDSVMSYIYFISYMLIIALIVLNLVVAVILEGFEDSASAIEDEIVNLAIDNWKRVDPEYTLVVTEAKAQ